MNIATYDEELKTAVASESFALILHVNPDIREHYQQRPLLTAAHFFAMTRVLPDAVVGCPIMGGSILREMAEALGAGGVLAYHARSWFDAVRIAAEDAKK